MYRNRLQNRVALLESGANMAYLLGTERGRSLLGLNKTTNLAIRTPQMTTEVLSAPALGSPALGAELSYSPGLMNMARALGPETGIVTGASLAAPAAASLFAAPALAAPAAASYSLAGVPALSFDAGLMAEASALPAVTAPSTLSVLGPAALAGGLGATAGKMISGALGAGRRTQRISGVATGAIAGGLVAGPPGAIIGAILGLF